MWYVEVDEINPQELDAQITVVVTDANGNELAVSYGPMNYIVRMNENGSDTLKALVKAYSMVQNCFYRPIYAFGLR